MTEITAERVREVLSYDPATGEFRWRVNLRKGMAGRAAGCRSWRYVKIAIDGKQYLAHRLAWLYVHGSWPSDQIDHIDGNGRNNALANLRSVSHVENQRNRSLRSNNTSGVSGVYRVRKTGMWCAQIVIDGVLRHIGNFPSIDDAAAARKRAEQSLGYHPNHGRAA